jgi:hypothetical protein
MASQRRGEWAFGRRFEQEHVADHAGTRAEQWLIEVDRRFSGNSRHIQVPLRTVELDRRPTDVRS